MRKTTLLLFGLFLTTIFAIAQESTQKSISTFQKNTQAIISLNKNLGVPAFIKFPINKPFALTGKSLKDKVNNFLQNNKSIYAIDKVDETFDSGTTKTDNYGLKHYILKQYYKGVPVYDSELRFHFNKNEDLNSINGNIIPSINLNSIPKLSEHAANTIALNLVKNQNINTMVNPAVECQAVQS